MTPLPSSILAPFFHLSSQLGQKPCAVQPTEENSHSLSSALRCPGDGDGTERGSVEQDPAAWLLCAGGPGWLEEQLTGTPPTQLVRLSNKLPLVCDLEWHPRSQDPEQGNGTTQFRRLHTAQRGLRLRAKIQPSFLWPDYVPCAGRHPGTTRGTSPLPKEPPAS